MRKNRKTSQGAKLFCEQKKRKRERRRRKVVMTKSEDKDGKKKNF